MTHPYISRFAPSPSGPLHFGSLLAAVAGWLDARAAGGLWLLRIEDIDPPREPSGAKQWILDALIAHGLHYDGEAMLQSGRDAAYAAALDELAAAGMLFRCTCTRQDLRAHGGVYPGTCRERGMTPLPDGTPHALRVRVPDGDAARIRFQDRLRGAFEFDLAAEQGDFIVRRKDGLWAYQLAVVVDDAEQGITDVVRGVDLLDSTPRQIHLQRLLGLPTPRYLHLPILVDERGDKLSKQAGAQGLDLATPRANLARALAWLDLPADPGLDVGVQLQRALAVYRPQNLPPGPIHLC
ncbi:MAG: tRNA glutamyl-Q(34) synthetase GluQRS [Gammaproteobacteria bacterium]|nr:tRNA glutamyl-Q(34) synthetase GluQRS [Gammaproteobacteria bacterium]